MDLVRSYRTELAPSEEQLPLLHQHAGIARFAYNWGLRWISNLFDYNQFPHPRLKFPTAVDLHRELKRLEKTR